jgi:uncharacterized protein
MIQAAALAIMAKQPVVGQTKTRLLPYLAAEETAALAEAFLLDTIALVTSLAPQADLVIAVTPQEGQAYIQTITPPGTLIFPVGGIDLGACLLQTTEWLLAQGYRKAFAIAADGPSLPSQYLHQAIAALDGADIVLGPGEDGGYYLVGMKQLHRVIFEAIDWGTSRVLSQTLERAAQAGLRVALTPPWYDVDTPADLLRLKAELCHASQDTLPHTRLVVARLALDTRSR